MNLALQFEEYVARVPTTLVRTVWDINNMARMEDRLFKMDERGKILKVKWMFFLLDLISIVQREAIKRMKRSQVMEQNNERMMRQLYRVLGWGGISGAWIEVMDKWRGIDSRMQWWSKKGPYF